MEYEIPNVIFLRPVFIVFIIILCALLIFSIVQKREIVNMFSIVSITVISVVISALCLYATGYIADEYGAGSDATSTILCMVVALLALINVIVYLIKHRNKLA
ncbi:hypothetical protein [Evansella cellulosilytica]|uniref:Uncharacterized protein n=1 Tax=Evansella cellulosilytica (strain ATCC 21833 / DSM 2522 / FERM P-1141 / JCM 9156 / N-4) TaxID=649639 RepID=E6TYE3_EVAC2|nr:hypothetical protein [Evansella cellulosilytica]ADU28881.1 hypothetical protein Bcell_0599 [Evansella cellulosilytica DSM 2522]